MCPSDTAFTLRPNASVPDCPHVPSARCGDACGFVLQPGCYDSLYRSSSHPAGAGRCVLAASPLAMMFEFIMHFLMRHGEDMDKPSEAMASFHETKGAIAARLSEGQSPGFRSRRRMSSWNRNR